MSFDARAYADGCFRDAYRGMTLNERLECPVAALAEVSEVTAKHLDAVGIRSVGDLARHPVFVRAHELCRHHDCLDGDCPPADMLTKSEAAALEAAVGSLRTRELACWKPFEVARFLLESC